MNKEKVNKLLLRQRQRGTRVERDKEVFDFINSLDRYYTIRELRELISERFGNDRTPSNSSLGRFLARITREAAKIEAGSKRNSPK